MQFKNNYYFLDHDINLNPNEYGAVFIDSRNNIDFMIEAGHIIMYGYNKIGGKQFRRLTQYEKSQYFHNNNLVIMDTIYGTYYFRVFSVHKEDTDEEYTKILSSKEMMSFVNDCIENSMYVPKNIPEDNSVILTFTTDIDDEDGNRLLIHAYLEED